MSDANAQSQKVGADRSALLENYHKASGLPVIEKEGSEEAPVEALASSDNALPKSDSAARPEGEKSEETPGGTPVKLEKSDANANKSVEKKDEEKLVSKKALDEEREKRKAKTLEARTALAERDAERQSRLQLEARVKELESKIAAQPAKPGAVPAKEDEVTKQLAEENRRLKEENQKATVKAQADAAAASAAQMTKLVSDTSKSLETEGFPGFSRFTVEVAHALEAKVASGELDVDDITPALWAKTYKEEVYPSIKQIFAEKQKQEKLEAKKAAKKEASLAKNPGNAPSAAEEEDADGPQSAESYMKFRKVLK